MGDDFATGNVPPNTEPLGWRIQPPPYLRLKEKKGKSKINLPPLAQPSTKAAHTPTRNTRPAEKSILERMRTIQAALVLDAASSKAAILPSSLQPKSSLNNQPPAPEPPVDIVLSTEQSHVLRVVEAGQSVFFTGSAGTGKSVLIRAIITSLVEKHGRQGIAITASTGLSACEIGGRTLASWAGTGARDQEPSKIIALVLSNNLACERWRIAKTLLIDEISMVDAQIFDILNFIGQQIRGDKRPFGGIQLVVTGDFAQLPPVSRPKPAPPPAFAFEAQSWDTSLPLHFFLTQVFRQADPVFVDLLRRVRTRTLNAPTISLIKSLICPLNCPPGLEPTKLFATRLAVDKANRTRLSQLDDYTYVYRADDHGSCLELLKDVRAPDVLELATGAQVMYLRNRDNFLVNGRIGRVIAMLDSTQWDGHPNMPEIIPYPSFSAVLPVVRFPDPNSADGYLDTMVYPESWPVEDDNGIVVADRLQLPLTLAWAMSIHKAQGQSLPHVTIDLSQVFAKGQSYVAMSRATALAGLQVLGFSLDKILCDSTVVDWYASRQWAPFL